MEYQKEPELSFKYQGRRMFVVPDDIMGGITIYIGDLGGWANPNEFPGLYQAVQLYIKNPGYAGLSIEEMIAKMEV